MAESSKPAEDSESLKTSPLYRDPHADVTFVSADGITFKLHSKYFGAVSAGFSAPETTLVDLPVTLTEPATVLEFLFQFIHPPCGCEQFHQPSVMKTPILLFFDLATAAEKYVVYAAMNVCLTRMHCELYASHPVKVLNHAANHGYDELADKAAPKTMSLLNTLRDTLGGLTDPKVAVKWMKYYGHWLEVPKVAGTFTVSTSCSRYTELLLKCFQNLILKPTWTESAVTTPSAVCSTNIPTCYYKRYSEAYIRTQLYNKIMAIPSFSKVT